MDLTKIQTEELATILVVNDENRIDSRLVHHFLEIKTKHIDWIQRRINEIGFVDGFDYHFSILRPDTGAGSPTKIFMLSLNMAKELSMLEKNERGKQARRYFIACEEKLKNVINILPKTLPEALRAYADEVEAHEKTQLLLTEKTIELDENKDWYSVKRMFIENGKPMPSLKTMQYHGRELTKLSKQHGYEVKKIFDVNYNLVGGYHVDIYKIYDKQLAIGKY